MTNFENFLKFSLKPEEFNFADFKFINAGSFGSVYKVWHEPSKVDYAIKMIELKSGNKQADQVEEALKEIKILEKLSSYDPKPKAIPNFYGYLKETSFKSISLYLVFDYFPKSLLDYEIELEQDHWQFLSNIFRSLLHALAFLQTIDICHRDLKPNNVMLDNNNKPFLIDFGISKNRSDNHKNNLTSRTDMTEGTILGTPIYMSPELLLAFINNDDSVRMNPYKSDAFSFGLVILELGSRIKLKYKDDLKNLEEKISDHLAKFKQNFQFLVSEGEKEEFEQIYNLTEICLKTQEKDRMDFVSMVQSILIADKAKMKYLLFIQENSIEDLKTMNWSIEQKTKNLQPIMEKNQENKENSIEDLKTMNWSIEQKTKNIQPIMEKNQENIIENKTIQKEKEDDLILKKYSGILQNLSITDLNEAGFKIAWQKPYCYQNKFDELLQFLKKKYVIIGAIEKGKNQLILAAMGEGKKVFKETKDIKETHEHNKVFWYFMRKKSFGFSETENVYLDEIDCIESRERREFEKGKLSWCLTENFGGWRIGDITDLQDSINYEKIILIKDD